MGGGCRPSSPPFPPRLSLSYTFTYVLYNISRTCAYQGVRNFFEDFFGKFLCFLEIEIRPFSLLPAISSIDEASNNKVSTQAGKVGKLAFFEKSFSKWKAGKGGEKF